MEGSATTSQSTSKRKNQNLRQLKPVPALWPPWIYVEMLQHTTWPGPDVVTQYTDLTHTPAFSQPANTSNPNLKSKK